MTAVLGAGQEVGDNRLPRAFFTASHGPWRSEFGISQEAPDDRAPDVRVGRADLGGVSAAGLRLSGVGGADAVAGDGGAERVAPGLALVAPGGVRAVHRAAAVDPVRRTGRLGDAGALLRAVLAGRDVAAAPAEAPRAAFRADRAGDVRGVRVHPLQFPHRLLVLPARAHAISLSADRPGRGHHRSLRRHVPDRSRERLPGGYPYRVRSADGGRRSGACPPQP